MSNIARFLGLAAPALVLASLAYPAGASSVEPSRISLPKGPASVEGLGRNFVPSLASGTAAYGVEIAMPPGVAGFVPKLALEYDSAGGVSELGTGWRLGGVPSVRRRTENGLPRFDETDTFEVTGLGVPCDLLEVAPGMFRPEFEDGTFARVKRGVDGGTWEARVKNGFSYRFGGEGYTEEEDGRAATYLLRSQHDLHGHTIDYAWDAAAGYALLRSVTYNGFSAESRVEVSFAYEGRPDTHVLFSSGIRRELTQRLEAVEVTLGGSLVRRYELAYHDADGHSRLSSIRMVGTDGETAMPTLSFGYTEPSFVADGQITYMTSGPGRSPGEANTALADLDGDSLPDLLVAEAGAFRSYTNHDGISWQPGTDWGSSASPSVSLGTTGVQLADVDGDGSIDLLAKSGASSLRYFTGTARFGEAIVVPTVPNITFEDPDVRLADMDGDRRSDVVVTTEAGLAIGYNVAGRDFALPETVGRIDATQELRFSDGRTQLCDVNGDRVQDLCHLRSGALTYWLGRGRGRFEPAQTGSGVPEFPESDPWRLFDLDGDGWVDLIHVGVSVVEVALASGAGAFGPVQSIGGVPEKGLATAVEFADMNGSGTTDIVWIDVTGSPEESWRYLELFPNGRAGLLARVDNGLGKVTTVEYEPAAAAAARARDAGQAWTTRMDVGMPVVRRTTVDSSLSDPLMATEFDYRDGTWDATERTFAGFAAGTERNVGDASTPTLLTDTGYDMGLLHRTLRGQPLTVEVRDEEGPLFMRTTNTYRTLELGTTGVEYGYRNSEMVVHIEGTDESTARTVLTEWEHDQYGNETLVAKWGEVAGADKLVGNDESIVRRTYANNEEDWILGYVSSERTEDAAGKRLAEKRSYYDGEPLQGLPLSEVTRGDLRRVESWIEGDRFADEQKNEHDEHGNVIVSVDGRGGRTESDYDASHTFVVAERRYPAPGRALEWTATYDARFGAVSSVNGPNGDRTEYAYDALGRVVAIAKPGDTLELPTLSYQYELAAPLSEVRTEQREKSGETGTIISVARVDGLGRARGAFTESANASRWILSELVAYDARGNARFKGFPSEETSTELPSASGRDGTETAYDARGRAIEARHLDGASTRTEYGALARTVWDENDNDPASPHFGTPTTFVNDGLERLVRVVERGRPGADSGETAREIVTGAYAYDALGNLLSAVDAAGSSRAYTYDGRSRRRTIEDPNAGHWELEYTDGNDLERRGDPEGNVVRHAYDGLGRELEEWHAAPGEDEELVAEYHYDEVAAGDAGANALGRLAWVTDAAGTVSFGYTGRGLLARQTRVWPEGTEHTTWKAYDAADRVVQRGFPDHTHLDLTYDPRGLISSLGPVAPGVSWTTDGQLARIEFGSGVTDLREYDQRRRLHRLTTSAPDGGKLVDVELALDGASRIAAQRDLRPGVSSAESLTRSYVYDDRQRLISARDPVATTTWTYDDGSNVRSVTSGHADPGLNVTNTFDDADGPDRMTRFGAEPISYDAAGRVIADGERTLEWDARGRLARVVRGEVVEEYVYDYAGVRAEKRTTTPAGTTVVRYPDRDVEVRDGALVRYVFLGEQRVARLDDVRLGSGTPVGSTSAQLDAPSRGPLNPWAMAWLATAFGMVVVFGRRREALVGPLSYGAAGWPSTAALLSAAALAPGCRCSGNQNGEPMSQRIDVLPATAVLYHADHQGSPLVLTDAHGKLVQRLAYHPFGALRSGTGDREDPFAFVGNELDDATGLADFRARPYRSEAAMFLAPDPLAVFQPEKVLAEPWKLAPYGYAGADPIQRSDPTGLEGVTVIGAEKIPRAMAAAPRISRQLPEGCETGASACWSSNAKFQGRVLSGSYDEERNVTTFRLEYRLTVHSAEIVTRSLEELRKTDAYNPDTGWTVRDHEWLHGYVDQRLYSKEHLEAVVRANGLDTVELPGRKSGPEYRTVENAAATKLQATVRELQNYWHALLVHRERPTPPGPR